MSRNGASGTDSRTGWGTAAPWGLITRATVAILAVLAIILGGLVPTPSEEAQAATTNSCTGLAADDQNNLRVTASHGKVFYIDSGQSQALDSAYVSYRVENRSVTTAQTNLWAKLDTFTGGAVGLANPGDASMPLGDLAASSSNTAFFMLKATASSSKAQSHVVHVYSGKPGTVGATELYSCTFSFAKVSETIKAAANKVTSIQTTSVTTIGSTMTITVEGNTGTIGAGNAIDGSMIWISPAARSTWPTGALRLESTNFSLYSNNSRNVASFLSSYANQLRIPMASGGKYYYTAVYVFRITGVSAVTSASVVPVAQIASGTQIKHTDLATLSSAAVSPSASVVNATVNKTVGDTVVVSGGYTTLDYTVTLVNGGSAMSMDSITDQRDAGLSFVPGSAAYNGVPIADPGLVVGSQNSLVFSGPFAMTVGPSIRTLTYKMTVPTCTGAFLYNNAATGAIGAITIGSTASTRSVSHAGGTCGSTSLTTHNSTDETLPIEVITSPASTITTTTARVNGLVDPNGLSLQNIVFELGASATLAGASSSTIGTTTTSTASYAVFQDLTSLTPGTLYYYRLSVGGVLGDILSFVTPEAASVPTATTTAATDITTTTASINGSVDPNQVANGAKVKFQYATDSSGGACTSLGSVTTTGFVQSETDNSTEDAVLLGSFPSDISYPLTGLTPNNFYCYKVVAYYNASTANWVTPVVASNWVAFKASVKIAQTITFANPGGKTIGASFSAGGNASSGLTVAYSSNTTDICTVSGSTITTIAEGTCSVTADQAGNDTYSAADPVTVTFPVTKVPQVITFTTQASATAGDLIVLTGTTNATGLVVSYVAGPSGVCSIDVDGNLQTGPGTGTCTVTASQAGSSTYFAALDVDATITVDPGPPVITTLALDDGIIDGAYSETLAAAGGDETYTDWELTSGLLPQGLFLNTATGEIWGTPTEAGTFELTFTVVSAGQTSVERALSITIAKKPQTISASSFSRAYGSLPVTTGASSDAFLPLTFASSDEGVATVSGGLVTPVGVGVTTITASAAGNDEYLAAPDATFTVTITAVTLTVTASSHSVTFGDAAPTYGYVITGFVGTEDASALTALPSCTSSYTSSSNAGTTPAVTCSGASAANYTFSYVPGAVTIGTSGECTWVGDVITASGSAGTCTVTASVPASTNYFAAADVVRTAEVTPAAKLNRTISLELDNPGASHTLIETLTGETTLGPVVSPIAYSVTLSSAGICSINASTGVITLLGVGDCTIVASVDADEFYNPAEAQLTFVVTLAPRTLALVATPTQALVGDSMTLVATPSAGTGTITYTLLNGALHCALVGNVVTGLSAGDCEVEATITASGAYGAATSSGVLLTVTAPSTPTPTRTPTPSPSATHHAPPAAEPVTTPTPTPTPEETEEPRPTEMTSDALKATGRLPKPEETTPVIGEPAAPGAPDRDGQSVDTVDVGRGIEPADTASPSLDQATRTMAALLSESFSGFAPGSGVIVQVTGARTAAQFVVSPGGVLDTVTITEAIAESRLRLEADFAAVDGSSLATDPEGADVIGGTPTRDARQVFADAGLADPITAGQLEVATSQAWVNVSAHVEGYAAGTVVYLAVTTDPVIVGASLVSKTGTADLSGMVPADLLESGAHSLRIVGIRQLSGITADADGTVIISDAAMEQIQRFDLGTQATVRLIGANLSGGSFQAVRVVLLAPVAPWWTVLVLGLVGLVLSAAIAFARRSHVRWAVAASVGLLALTVLPEVAGWLTSAYEVMGWGLVVGGLVQLLLWGGRWVTRRVEDRREDRRHINLRPISHFSA